MGTVLSSSPVGKRVDQGTLAAKVPLKILPLGASITWGEHSSTGNGYRQYLLERLQHDGWSVTMVGNNQHGDMVNNNVEAYPGYTIDQVREAATHTLGYRPNVVLIEAGTNDCHLNIDIAHAGDRMRSVITTLVNGPGMKKSLIVLGTLIPSGNAAILAHRQSVNDQYRALVGKMRQEGTSIILVDMDAPVPEGNHTPITYPADFTQNGVVDDTHPGDAGYVKMAALWYQAILQAGAQNLIPPPQ